jgi:hypothetical protein
MNDQFNRFGWIERAQIRDRNSLGFNRIISGENRDGKYIDIVSFPAQNTYLV